MTLSLRYRILLALLPLLVLLAVIGGSAMVLLQDLGGRARAILRENYDSVLYMERLNEALERIDSSFAFALAREEKRAKEQYATNWRAYREWLGKEQGNITEPGEGELVARLTELTEQYQRLGDAFYQQRAEGDTRKNKYFAEQGGLLATFNEIKDVSGQILRLNQESMERASQQARETARVSVIGFGVGLPVAALAALALAWWTTWSILHPLREVTASVRALGAGNLDQVVPVLSRDELGQLAEAFNVMARQLRHYRQTDYSRLLRAQRTSQATIDSFPDPVLVVDPEGHVEMANPAAQRLFGVSSAAPPGPAGGKTVEREPVSVPWQPPEPLREPLREAIAGQRPYLPDGFDRTVALRVDGQERSFLPRLLPIRDPYGSTLGAAVLLEDVTRFRLLDQVKNDLVATASHELKTPLTSIRLALHVLLEEAVGPLTPKQTELLLDARDSAERLLAMVNNLLDLARLEQGRQHLDLRPEAPADLLCSAAEEVKPRAEDKGVAVAVEAAPDLPAVAVDGERMRHALSNLLNNALAFTERAGRITLSAEAADGHVTLVVADTGVGIPPEHLPHIFERFARVPGRRRGSGTGLGLAIVREIVAGHGGTIAVESEPGVGTTFRIRLPAWTGEPAAAGPRESAPTP
jgi:signal transduction histidine kinase/HAMP domain-containing protein